MSYPIPFRGKYGLIWFGLISRINLNQSDEIKSYYNENKVKPNRNDLFRFLMGFWILQKRKKKLTILIFKSIKI